MTQAVNNRSVNNRARVIGGVILALICCLLVLNIVRMARGCDSLRPMGPGRKAPSFELESLTGQRIGLSTLKGQVVLVSFWASWCNPCMRELPYLNKLQLQEGERGLQILAVNVGEGREIVEQVAKETGSKLTMLLDDGSVAARFSVQTLPHLVVVDRGGTVHYVHVGAGRDQLLRDKVRQALERAPNHSAGPTDPAVKPD